MRYAYHFEFCERPELPEWLRGDLLLSLAWTQNLFGLTNVLGTTVPEFLKKSGAHALVELGSGSGDGLVHVSRGLPLSFPILATDFFPHPALWQSRLGEIMGARWSTVKVGFDNFHEVLAAERLEGSALLMTTAFHHIPPDAARRFLENAAAVGAHVIVVEPLERTMLGVFLGGATGLPALVFPLLARGVGFFRRLRMAVFHWAVPLIPAFLSHDGVVSSLRQRTHSDWQELLSGLPFELDVRKNLGILGNFSVLLLKNSPHS